MKIRLKNILFNVLAIVTALTVVFVVFNIASGAKGYAVTSNSMRDTLNRGDLVFVKAVSFEELKVGDVITVSSTDGKRFFTHRIVEINTSDKTVTTRGDANGANDPMPAEEQRIVGKLWYSVPLLGFFAIWFSGVSLMTGVIILAIVAVALILINSVLIKNRKKRGDIDEQN